MPNATKKQRELVNIFKTEKGQPVRITFNGKFYSQEVFKQGKKKKANMEEFSGVIIRGDRLKEEQERIKNTRGSKRGSRAKQPQH